MSSCWPGQLDCPRQAPSRSAGHLRTRCRLAAARYPGGRCTASGSSGRRPRCHLVPVHRYRRDGRLPAMSWAFRAARTVPAVPGISVTACKSPRARMSTKGPEAGQGVECRRRRRPVRRTAPRRTGGFHASCRRSQSVIVLVILVVMPGGRGPPVVMGRILVAPWLGGPGRWSGRRLRTGVRLFRVRV